VRFKVGKCEITALKGAAFVLDSCLEGSSWVLLSSRQVKNTPPVGCNTRKCYENSRRLAGILPGSGGVPHAIRHLVVLAIPRDARCQAE
jgi:hypothetical protein